MSCVASCNIKSNQSDSKYSSRSKGVCQRIQRWYVNWSTRQQLLTLDSRQLKDVGITPWQAMEEAAKPFWKD